MQGSHEGALLLHKGAAEVHGMRMRRTGCAEFAWEWVGKLRLQDQYTTIMIVEFKQRISYLLSTHSPLCSLTYVCFQNSDTR